MKKCNWQPPHDTAVYRVLIPSVAPAGSEAATSLVDLPLLPDYNGPLFPDMTT